MAADIGQAAVSAAVTMWAAEEAVIEPVPAVDSAPVEAADWEEVFVPAEASGAV